MEKRKVISLGKASYAIILPKDWITENNVKKSDELFVYAQRGGKISIQKQLNPKTSVTIAEADALSDEILRFAIHSAYILNVDDIILKTSNKDKLSNLLNKITQVSHKFQGFSTSFSENEVVLNCLIDMKTINVPKIFEEIFFIFKLILNQISAGHYVDNINQINDMERKYILGVRYLIYTLQHQYDAGGGLDHLIQTLGYRVCLKVIRNLTKSIHILHKILNGKKIADFQDVINPIQDITQAAIQLTLNPNFEKLKKVEKEYRGLKAELDEIEVKDTEYHEALLTFIETFKDSINTFLHTAMSRYTESKIGLIAKEEEEISA